MQGPARRLVPSALVFAAGATFAAVTSAGLVEERMSSGSPRVAVVANGLVTFGAILVLALVQRRAPEPTRAALAPQALGAAGGIALVHLALRAGLFAWSSPTPAWLCERPAQLMNDAVAVFSTLAVVWACARRLDLRLLVAALLSVTAYRASAALWHLDLAPRGFLLPVQDLVFAQVVAVALVLPVYRTMTTRHAD